MSNITSQMTSFNQAAVQALAARFQGRIILPDNSEYDQARRVWNGMIDRYPALIVRPTSSTDVIAAVVFAHKFGLTISMRGGGHNVAGYATNDGGIVIDLSSMKQISVDPVNRIARAEGGVTWGELDAATQVYGLATPGGVYSKTGIAGLTLGGGFGWLRNQYGLSCDNLVGAELVTADGRLIRASTTENAELLWGLRGGGGNFGVVTTFEYQLHCVGPDVAFAFVFHDGSDADEMKRAVRFYRDFSATAPDEVSTLMALGQIPPDEHFPEALHRTPFILFGGLFAGEAEEGQRVLKPLLDFGTPLIDLSGIKPYVKAQQAFDTDFPDGLHYYWKSLNLSHMDDAAIERLVTHARQQPSPFSTTDLWHVGGAVARQSADASAFYGRQAAFLINAEANWTDAADDAANLAWVRGFIADMEPFSDGSRYLNFPGFQEEGDAMIRSAFGKQYARLARLKRTYDPTNLFHLNQNIKPE
jgi:FAD/FMN-containing dehydrogenase